MDLHNLAMRRLNESEASRIQGDTAKADALLDEAFDLERSAAEQLLLKHDAEPTRAILYRSAAALALRRKKTAEAERMALRGLAGDPPAEIAVELREILERAGFERHLDVVGVKLLDGDMQLSIAGSGVGGGMIRSNDFTERVDQMERIVIRTTERLAGKPFRRGGAPTTEFRRRHGLFLEAPRAASFAITLKVGEVEQLELFEAGEPTGVAVVREVIATLSLFDSGDLKELEKRVPDARYRENLVGLATQLAPDGERVKLVGLTATIDGAEVRAALATPRRELASGAIEGGSIGGEEVQEPLPNEPGRLTLRGRLLSADSTSQDVIGIVDAAGAKTEVFVPDSMVDDVVKPYYRTEVVARVRREGDRLVLERVVPAS